MRSLSALILVMYQATCWGTVVSQGLHVSSTRLTALPAAPEAEAPPDQALRVARCAVLLRCWAMRPIQEGLAHSPSPAGSSED